jgi:hypothetical protein
MTVLCVVLFYLDFCWPACSAIGWLTGVVGVACVVTIACCGRCGGGKGPFHNAPEKAVCVTVQKLESNSGSVAEEKWDLCNGIEAGAKEVRCMWVSPQADKVLHCISIFFSSI